MSDLTPEETLRRSVHRETPDGGDVSLQDALAAVAGNYADHEDASDAMGIDWMDRKGLAQAIPPAYTEFIGGQLLDHVNSVRAAA